MPERRLLSEILQGTDSPSLQKAWDNTKAADELGPLPAGEYRCNVVEGGLFSSRGGTPGFKVTLEVAEGEYAGRRLWHDVWLTAAALPLAKRDLSKLGVVRVEQLEKPLPEGMVITAKVALRRDDDGTERN